MNKDDLIVIPTYIFVLMLNAASVALINPPYVVLPDRDGTFLNPSRVSSTMRAVGRMLLESGNETITIPRDVLMDIKGIMSHNTVPDALLLSAMAAGFLDG